ncbi:hypothetical protein ABZ172_12675 [Streptomyces sp. NPDC006296]
MGRRYGGSTPRASRFLTGRGSASDGFWLVGVVYGPVEVTY